MSKISIEVQYFGAFRALGEKLNIDINKGISMNALKKELSNKLGSDYALLIEESVVANNEEILDGLYLLESDMKLSILPPVCGG